MKKIVAIEKINNYENVNSYVNPTKTIDSGAHGKAFETLVKIFLTGRVSTKNCVSAKGKKDLSYHKLAIECKSACGTLDGIEKNDFIIYSYDSTIENARVFTPSEFMELVNACGLYRTKKTTSGYTVSAIQSFKNSKKKFAMWTQATTENGLTLETFKATY